MQGGQKETYLRYTNDFGQKKFHIFEVDEKFLEEIAAADPTGESDAAQIKMAHAYQEFGYRQAAVSTQKSTYKLKQSETTNMLMAVNLSEKKEDDTRDILNVTSAFVEVTSTQRKDHQIFTYLRLNHDVFGRFDQEA